MYNFAFNTNYMFTMENIYGNTKGSLNNNNTYIMESHLKGQRHMEYVDEFPLTILEVIITCSSYCVVRHFSNFKLSFSFSSGFYFFIEFIQYESHFCL